MGEVQLSEAAFNDRAELERSLRAAAETEEDPVRPKIRYKRAAANVLIPLFAGGLLAVALYFAVPIHRLSISLSSASGALALYFFIRLKDILIWLITVYQARAKAETRARCVFTPSCSVYAVTALRRFGVCKGCVLTIRRLLRCRVPNGGFDPVPEKKARRSGKAAEQGAAADETKKRAL